MSFGNAIKSEMSSYSKGNDSQAFLSSTNTHTQSDIVDFMLSYTSTAYDANDTMETLA